MKFVSAIFDLAFPLVGFSADFLHSLDAYTCLVITLSYVLIIFPIVLLYFRRKGLRSSRSYDILHDEGETAGEEMEGKMVIVVRNDLKMGKGKIGAQCSHAAVTAFEKARCSSQRNIASSCQNWFSSGQKKVVVKVDSLEALLDLQTKAKRLHVNQAIIRDAGRTQIEAGSQTCLAIGPDSELKLNEISGHLKLL